MSTDAMTTYLDVSVVRIQQYISRFPALRGVRGSSAMLSEASVLERDHYERFGVSHNPYAGEIDGVISVIVNNATDPVRAARDLLRCLREQLPGAELEASWGDASSYQSFRYVAPKETIRDAPAVTELPLALRCETCQIDPAVGPVTLPGQGTKRACADCCERVSKGDYRTAEKPEVGLDAERALYESLGRAQFRNWTCDFNSLAKLVDGPNGRNNHLATVAFDGDRIGSFMRDLLERNELDDQVASKLVSALKESGRIALKEATRSVSAGLAADDPLPVVPHVRGGDDITVTVAAPLVWGFVNAFLATFQVEMTQRLGNLDIAGSPITMSAGVVIAHATYPYSRTSHLAQELMARAKRDGSDRVMWVDVTSDGETVPDHRNPLTRSALDKATERMAATCQLSRSVRQSLWEIETANEPTSVRRARSKVLARRLGVSDVVSAFDDELPLVTALELARWWPCES